MVERRWAEASLDRPDAAEALTVAQGFIKDIGGEMRDSPGFAASLPPKFRIDFAAVVARAFGLTAVPPEVGVFFVEIDVDPTPALAAAVKAAGFKKCADLLELDHENLAELHGAMSKIEGKRFATEVKRSFQQQTAAKAAAAQLSGQGRAEEPARSPSPRPPRRRRRSRAAKGGPRSPRAHQARAHQGGGGAVERPRAG